VLVETTSQWGIGLLPPGVMHANDWRVMDLEALWPAG
jgi:hypothetical protein